MWGEWAARSNPDDRFRGVTMQVGPVETLPARVDCQPRTG